MYDKQFTKDELNNLKASEVRAFKKMEDHIVITLFVVLIMLFISFVSLVALLIWSSKFSLFLFIVVIVPTILLDILYFRLIKTYRMKVTETKSRINEGGN